MDNKASRRYHRLVLPCSRWSSSANVQARQHSGLQRAFTYLAGCGEYGQCGNRSQTPGPAALRLAAAV